LLRRRPAAGPERARVRVRRSAGRHAELQGAVQARARRATSARPAPPVHHAALDLAAHRRTGARSRGAGSHGRGAVPGGCWCWRLAQRGRSPCWPPACMPSGHACMGRPILTCSATVPRLGLARWATTLLRADIRAARPVRCPAAEARAVGARLRACPGEGRTRDGTRCGAGSARAERARRRGAGQRRPGYAAGNVRGPRALQDALVAPGAASAGAAHACMKSAPYAAGLAARLQRCMCRFDRQRRSPQWQRREEHAARLERPSSCSLRSAVCRARRSTKGWFAATPSCVRACCRPPWRRWRPR